MSIKAAYHYFYYKLYKLFQVDDRDWWSEWKASSVLSLLASLFLLSMAIYYKVFIDKYFSLISISRIKLFLFFMLFIALPNYFIFHHRDQWKSIVAEYEELSKKQNRRGDWIVYSIVFLIIANLAFAFYLMSQIDWKQYR